MGDKLLLFTSYPISRKVPPPSLMTSAAGEDRCACGHPAYRGRGPIRVLDVPRDNGTPGRHERDRDPVRIRDDVRGCLPRSAGEHIIFWSIFNFLCRRRLTYLFQRRGVALLSVSFSS